MADVARLLFLPVTGGPTNTGVSFVALCRQTFSRPVHRKLIILHSLSRTHRMEYVAEVPPEWQRVTILVAHSVLNKKKAKKARAAAALIPLTQNSPFDRANCGFQRRLFLS